MGIVATSDEWLTKGVFVSSTFGGEQKALREAIKNVRKTSECDIDKTWNLGMAFQAKVNHFAPDICRLRGYPTRFVWECESETTKAKIWQSMYKKGFLCGAAFFPKLSWIEHDFDTIYIAIRESIEEVNKTILMGIPPQPVFKRV